MGQIEKRIPIRPPKLAPGSTIGVVAPAGPVNPTELAAGISALKSLGYDVILGEHVYRARAYLAGEDAERLSDLNKLIRDPAIRAVFCARGGYGSMRLLNHVDYSTLSRFPKIFVGFSDVTTLLHAIYHKSGVVTFHGPMVKNFTGPDDEKLTRLMEVLNGAAQWEMSLNGARVLRPGRAEGIVVGGNLSILALLAGSPYFPDLKGTILFIEDTQEPLYRIDRMLVSLKLRGWFNDVKALVAGEFHSCGNPADIDGLLEELTDEFNIPLVSGAPFAHGKKNLPFPIGMPAVLDTEELIVYSECPVVVS